MKKPTVIDLFCGAGGLSFGFRELGFDLLFGVDIDKWGCLSYAYNYGDEKTKKFIEQNDIKTSFKALESDEFSIIKMKNIRDVKASEIKNWADKNIDVIIGGPPCQSFSTAGKRTSINDNRPRFGGDLVLKFIEIVDELKPKFFVFENVSGLKSAALKHIPFYERIQRKNLPKDYKLGTAFDFILNKFKETGYNIEWGILNSADFGVPQKRKRLFIIGSKEKKIRLPNTTHAPSNSIHVKTKVKKPWVTLKEAFSNLNGIKHEFINFPPWGKYLKRIPPGGYWKYLPIEEQKEVMKGAYHSQGGRTGYLRRLSWDKPAPTIVTSPIMKATCLAHPEEERPISIQECLTLQNFPLNWKLFGSTQIKYRLIGEAVPTDVGKVIAREIKLLL